MVPTLLSFAIVSNPIWEKASWKSYDFGCKGLRVELPVRLKKVEPAIKVKDSNGTVNYEGTFEGARISVAVKIRPSPALVATAGDGWEACIADAQRRSGIKDPKVNRFHEKRNGLDCYLGSMFPESKPDNSPKAVAFLGVNREVIVAIIVITKLGTKANMDASFRITNTVAWKPSTK